MIDYKPGLPPEEVNYSSTHPLLQMAQLLGGGLVVIVLLYWLAGLAMHLVADHFPQTMDSVLAGMGDLTLPEASTHQDPELSARLRTLLGRLTPHLGEDDSTHYTVEILDVSEVNALALPGGRIVVFSGLLDQVEDDQLLFVLAHELGHFHHRDHLTRFGRGIVAVFLAALITGGDSGLTDLAGSLLSGVESGFSRKQELAADRFALELLHKAELPTQGAYDFMRMIMEKDSNSELAYYFASHPSPGDRLQAMHEAGY